MHHKKSTMAGNLDDVPQALNQFHRTFHGLELTNWFITWHGNCPLTRFDFSIKILLVTITFESFLLQKQSFEFYYVICSICCQSVLVVFLGVVLLLRCSAAFLMFHYSVVFQLFYQYSVVCSASVLVFHVS